MTLASVLPVVLRRGRWPAARLFEPHCIEIRRRTRLLDPARGYFELRNLATRVESAVRQPVGAALTGPMVRNEDRVRANGANHHRLRGHLAAPRRHFHPVAVLDTVLP